VVWLSAGQQNSSSSSTGVAFTRHYSQASIGRFRPLPSRTSSALKSSVGPAEPFGEQMPSMESSTSLPGTRKIPTGRCCPWEAQCGPGYRHLPLRGAGNGAGLNYRVYGMGFTRGPQFHADHRKLDDWRMGQVGFRTDWDKNSRDYLHVSRRHLS